MTDPWKILKLSPRTATIGKVRAAYAKLLKRHRPEGDPEAFRRVHDAYRAALRWLEHRNAPPEDGITTAGRVEESPSHSEGFAMERRPQTAGIAAPASLPEICAVALAAVAIEARQRWQRFQPWRKRRAFQVASLTMDDAELPAQTRARAWLAAFGGSMAEFAGCVPDEVLLHQLSLEDAQMPLAVVGAWRDQGEWRRMSRFARSLGRMERHLSHLDAWLMTQVARTLALEDPERADVLVTLAYSPLTPDERRIMIHHIEVEILHGRLLRLLPRGLRRFWIGRMRESPEALDGRGWRVRRLVRQTMRRSPPGWAGWSVLQSQLTPAFWERTKRRLKWEEWWKRRHVLLRMCRPRFWKWYLAGVGSLMLLAHFSDNATPRSQPVSPQSFPQFGSSPSGLWHLKLPGRLPPVRSQTIGRDVLPPDAGTGPLARELDWLVSPGGR